MVGVRRAPSPRPPAASRLRLPILLLTSIVLLNLTGASCGAPETRFALANADRTTVTEILDVPASVTARAVATLSAPADGTLSALRVDPGETVKVGQILAVIDSPVARNRLAKARQALDAAKRADRGVDRSSDLSRLRRDTDRAAARAFDAARAAAENLADQRLRATLLVQVQAAAEQYGIAARTADETVRAVQRGVAGLNSAVSALTAAQRLQAQQAYDLARSTVAALTLRAPIGGVVQLGGGTAPAPAAGALAGLFGAASVAGAGSVGGAARLSADAFNAAAAPAPVVGVDGVVPVGGRVTAGTPVLTVVDLSDLGLVADVDETDVLLLTTGLAATVELDAVTGASYPARVRAVDVLPTASARGGISYRVRLSLAAGRYADGRDAPAPRPGMSAVVRLRVREATDAVAVPAAAVLSTDGGDTVWAVRDGRAERVPVTVGVQGQDLVEIVSGIPAGQSVVVRGADQVRVGQRLP